MNTLLVTLLVFLCAFAFLAIGVILSNREIKGSCGGIGKVMGHKACDSCAFKDRCDKEEGDQQEEVEKEVHHSL